ncbi:hypothetical protein D3C71_943300 [compost metagenome]
MQRVERNVSDGTATCCQFTETVLDVYILRKGVGVQFDAHFVIRVDGRHDGFAPVIGPDVTRWGVDSGSGQIFTRIDDGEGVFNRPRREGHTVLMCNDATGKRHTVIAPVWTVGSGA